MKAVLLFGSPHDSGFTRMLADEYLSLLPDDCEITEYNAYSLNAAPCFGCGGCAAADICPQNDVDDLFDAIYECDLLIIASPVYYLTFPAPLKAVIDRMQRFHEAERRGDSRMHGRERRCAVLLTAGSPSENGEVIRKQLRWMTGSLGINETEIIVCADTDRTTADDFAERARAAVRRQCS